VLDEQGIAPTARSPMIELMVSETLRRSSCKLY
jgi:hypothetical protein